MTRPRSGHAQDVDLNLKGPRRSIVPTLSDPITDYPTTHRIPKKAVFANGATYTFNEKMLPMFYKFVCERHAIQQRRLAGLPYPWTRDKYLAEYPFTNVFRILDRNTQYILHRVIGEGSHDLQDSVFRVLLFRTFNKIETWELLESHFGELTWDGFSIEAYEGVLGDADMALYSPAYIIPAPKFGYPYNYQNHLRLFEAMMSDGELVKELPCHKHIKDAHAYLSHWPSMGDFTAMQLLLDLNMLPHFNWSEDEWVETGPGSKACLQKIFGDDVLRDAEWAIRYLRDQQWSWYSHVGVSQEQIPRVSPLKTNGLTMVDIEHSLCECEKYSRGKLPGIKGKRTSVGKRCYTPKDDNPTADVPEHWLLEREVEDHPCPPALDGDDLYEVECIVGEDKSRYRIRWLGWGPEDDTWEPKEGIVQGSPQLVKLWELTKKKVIRSIDKRKKDVNRTRHHSPVHSRTRRRTTL